MRTELIGMMLLSGDVTDMRHVIDTIERDRKFRERYEASRRAVNDKQNNYRYKNKKK